MNISQVSGGRPSTGGSATIVHASPTNSDTTWLGLEGAMPSHQLAKRLDVTPRTVTGLVDRLAESGHVTRSANPHDRRSTLVTLTERGEAFTGKLRAMQNELARDLFIGFPAERLEPLRADLTLVLERLQQLAALAKRSGPRSSTFSF